MEKQRLEAFSDGVIAIIITIMVLELRPPATDDLAALVAKLGEATLSDALALARLPEKIRGFGHVKRGSIDATLPEREALRAR